MEMGRWPRRNAIKTNLNSSSLPRENVKQANWVMKPNLFPTNKNGRGTSLYRLFSKCKNMIAWKAYTQVLKKE
jgi:hypothetical protein